MLKERGVLIMTTSPSNQAGFLYSDTSADKSLPKYLMEGPNEGQRMELKTDAYDVEQQLLWAGLRTGMRALDVGCATGAITRVMSRITAPGHVAGTDLSETRLEQAKQLANQENLTIDFIQSDI